MSGVARPSTWGSGGITSPDHGGHWNGNFNDRSSNDGEIRGETVCVVPHDKCGLVIGKGM